MHAQMDIHTRAGMDVCFSGRLLVESRQGRCRFATPRGGSEVTTSIDKSVRFWAVDSGEMQKVFTDSSPVPTATFLPFNPKVFVAANGNAVLRLVNIDDGRILQKLKVRERGSKCV